MFACIGRAFFFGIVVDDGVTVGEGVDCYRWLWDFGWYPCWDPGGHFR